MNDFNYDPEQLKNQTEQVEIVPEGKSLFTIYNFFAKKQIKEVKAKTKRNSNFIIYLNIQYMHKETGIIISSLDNNQEGRWATQLKLQNYDNVDTRLIYHQWMMKLGAPFYKGVDPKNPNMGRFHVFDEAQKMQYKAYDDTPVGPMGLPCKLNILHKEVPSMTQKKDVNGDPVTEVVKGYEKKVWVQSCNEKGEPETRIKEFINCTQPEPEFVDQFWSKEFQQSGWPVLYDLTDDEKSYRGEYHIFEASTSNSNSSVDLGVDESEGLPQKVEF